MHPRRLVTHRILGRLGPGSERNLADTLRSETVGGALVLIATVIALVWANSPWRDTYTTIRDTVVGPAGLHLNLSIGDWASDGLLAVFFFVVGLELKREFTVGDLRKPANAAIPIVAAIGGMVVPAGIYLAINLTSPQGAPHGWAIPTATDIAFAVAVLAVVNTHLPNALRAFLLTLAVVDDLLAITVIAIFYTDTINFGWLLGSLAVIVIFGVLVQRRTTSAWVLVPLALLAWGMMHSSGIHATIAGVLLGFTVPAIRRESETESLAERFEHRWRPISAGFAVPVFALFAAGVTLTPAALKGALSDPVAQGVALGLVVGKPIGILLATFCMAYFTRAQLAEGLSWWDVFSVACLGGIGFTVSLLVGSLAFGEGSARDDHVRIAILVGSLVSAGIGMVALKIRNHYYRLAQARVD